MDFHHGGNMIEKVKAKVTKVIKEATEFPPEFTLAELTRSDTAKRLGIDNQPTGETLNNLRKTAHNLVKVRELFYYPVIVNSGYRSLAVNRAIGSSDNSQHVKGEAVDFRTHQYTPRQIVEMIKKSDIPYDQLILEYESWVHISFSARNRRQVLIIDSKGSRNFV
jgi:hypothetical protein